MLVFGDDQTVFPRLGQPTAYVQGSGLVADESVIKRFALRLATRTSRVTRRDYDFEQPSLLLESAYKPHEEITGPDLEDYDYPGRFTERARGKHLSQRALERHRADQQLAEGESDQPLLRSGHFLDLSAHPRADWNQLWLLNEIHHEGKQPQVLEESITNFGASLPSPLRGEGQGEGARPRRSPPPRTLPSPANTGLGATSRVALFDPCALYATEHNQDYWTYIQVAEWRPSAPSRRPPCSAGTNSIRKMPPKRPPSPPLPSLAPSSCQVIT